MSIRHVPGLSVAFAERAVREVPGFVRSDEYLLLDEADQKMPGIVFSALARYLENATSTETEVAAAAIIEDAAATEDAELHNYIVTEIFEPWQSIDMLTRERLLCCLGSVSRSLYTRWIGPIGPGA